VEGLEKEVGVSHSILRLIEASRCESLLREINHFIDTAYTEANAIARRAHIYEYGMDLEAFAFPIHCPGSPETDHLPGFRLDELPQDVANLCRKGCIALGLTRGRVLFNVSRYCENAAAMPAHYDGELFDFTVEPEVGNTVRSGIRPSEVALLTLRNETRSGGTSLHDIDGKVIKTHAQAGELLVFDNTIFQHGVPSLGAGSNPVNTSVPPRWIRVTVGWRALEEGFYWVDGEPLQPIQFSEAIELHDQFLSKEWAERLADDLSRANFPFPTQHT
jgi:hypothetical protein